MMTCPSYHVRFVFSGLLRPNRKYSAIGSHQAKTAVFAHHSCAKFFNCLVLKIAFHFGFAMTFEYTTYADGWLIAIIDDETGSALSYNDASFDQWLRRTGGDKDAE